VITLFNIRPRALNVGNDVIARGLRHLLLEAFGEAVNLITLPATSRYEAHSKAGLNAATIYQINQYGHGVIVGGGNLYENGELEFDMNAIGDLAPPMMLFSLSMGRVYDRRGRLVERTDRMPADRVRRLNEKAFQSFARCDATLSYLRGIGLEKAELGGCPTVFLNEQADQLPVLAPANRGLTLIPIRNPALMNLSPLLQSRVKADIEAIIGLLRVRGHRDIRLLCHDFRDIEFAASFENIDYIYNDDAALFLALLKSARLCVSYRLHAALPALSFGVPCINISYDERAKSLMSTVGYGDWDIDMVTSKNMVAEVAVRLDGLARLDAVKAAAAPRQKELRRVAREGFAHFAGAVHDYAASLR
jgi:hypothetical protein